MLQTPAHSFLIQTYAANHPAGTRKQPKKKAICVKDIPQPYLNALGNLNGLLRNLQLCAVEVAAKEPAGQQVHHQS